MSAQWLRPIDDVATALADLPQGTRVRLACGGQVREVTLREAVGTGHKFAVHALSAGMRVRKYGEFIGRATGAIADGAWVHTHNLASSAQHDGERHAAWLAPEPATVTRVLGATRCHVGEVPLYDANHDRLFWIDVRETPAIHRLPLAGGAETRWPLREDIGSIALAGDDRLLVALRSGFAFFDCTHGTLSPIVDPEPALPRNRLNDGKCDAAGRYWCGSMNPESATADGHLYCLERTLECHHVLADLHTPNGMTWSADGATLYLADTRRGMIYAYPFDAGPGTLGERRVFADLGALPGGPDGATIDSEGYLWWAQVDGGSLIRFAPDGRMDRVLRLPVSRPTSCAFGGIGHRQLFVTTATRGLDDAALRAEPLAGHVLVLDVGVGGVPAVPFIPFDAGAPP
jgi:sugar lactone lactonase YvrE